MNDVIPLPIASISSANSLDEIAARIRHVQCKNIIVIGELLTIAKAKLKHGNFQAWAERELGIKAKTAQNYMNAASFVQGKSETISHLPPSILYQLAAPSAPKEIVAKVIAADIIDAGTIDTELDNYRRAQRKAKKAPLASIAEQKRSQRIKAQIDREDRKRADAEARIAEELIAVVERVREADLIKPLVEILENYTRTAVFRRMLRDRLS